MSGNGPPPLSDAQREIMDVIWKQGEMSASEVRDVIGRRRHLARNTVQTMLVRLEEKGWLTHRQRGRTFYYSAKRPRRMNLGSRVTQMIDRLFGGSPEEMVTALLEHRGLTTEEAKRIREMIEESERTTRANTQKE